MPQMLLVGRVHATAPCLFACLANACCAPLAPSSPVQPSPIAATWNFRGLANNAWHFVDLAVKGP